MAILDSRACGQHDEPFRIRSADLSGGAPGTKDVPAIDQKIAGLLGIDASQLLITDMIVNPKSGNAFISAMRGRGAGAAPVLLRVDGAGKIDVISLDKVRYTRIGLPNPPPSETPLVLGDRKIPVANAIELGKYSPSLALAFQIAHVFRLPLDRVFQYDRSKGRRSA